MCKATVTQKNVTNATLKNKEVLLALWEAQIDYSIIF